MKKRILKLLTLGLAVCTVSLTACGKSEQQLASEHYQEMGMSKEEADAFAEAFYGDGTSEESKEETPSIKLTDARSEIVNSKITDPFIQIQNTIIRIDESMTIGEAVALLEAESNIPVVIGEGDQSLDSMIDSIGIYTEDGIEICKLWGRNYSKNPTKVSELPIYDVQCFSIYELNYFYPGNICKATYSNSKEVCESDVYEERMAEYPALKYEEVPAFFESNGLICTEDNYNNRSSAYGVSYIWPNPVCTNENGQNEYVQVDYIVRINLETSTCYSYDMERVYRHTGDEASGDHANLDFLDQATKDSIIAEAVDTYLNDFWNVDSYGGAHSTKADIKGYFYKGYDKNKGTNFALLFETDGADKGCVVEFYVKSTLDGDLEISNMSYNSGFMNMNIESYDAWFEKNNFAEKNVLNY